MTALARHIARMIEAAGPIPISHYMALALGHPEHGYYMTRDPLGARGDFTTAPEVSQMFGELVGLWIADAWIAQGRPSPFILAELGPGRGTLMADALRALRAVPGVLDAARVHFVETSPVLRAAQARLVPRATWHERFDQLPPDPLFLVANEFFDALPIAQYVKTERGWCERHVALADGTTEENPRFVPVLAPVATPATVLPPAMRNADLGSIGEISPASTGIAEAIARRIAGLGGAALIIDYGHPKSAAGDTLQALKAHQYVDVFDTPGEADITAHVDFEALADAAMRGGAKPYGPVEQGAFLRALGIEARSHALKARATPAQAEAIDSALARLTAADQMGSLFKVLGLTAPSAPVPAGF
ncbi:class I SAM-dependent methyltransferase [Parvibaculum sedimenti]|uniref:Class I SAM-dependent methyltransferase n=1 Tax=Parvibaculum sedimenti TaxID=2608632 RepID=A0A6N6VJI0_9HYPH|nr:SAM-dependent methyltransferase [Parvibaculum sedimenti]KAB7739441.1 class I SAM-dependent methyltransferase [Parvibaculum sedimenti]